MTGLVSYLDSQGVRELGRPRHALLSLVGCFGAAQSRIVIVGRDITYYAQEEVSLRKFAEISAYVKANAAELCPFDNWYPVFTTKSHKSKTRLHIWFINRSYLDQHLSSRGCLLIPEELLIARHCTKSQIDTMQVATGQSVTYLLTMSSGTVRDNVLVPQNPEERDLFLQSSLVSPDQNLPLLAGKEKESVLAAEVWCLPFRRLLGCWCKSSIDYSVVVPELRVAGMIVVAMLVLWAVATSAYIGYQGHSLQQKLASQEEGIKAALVDRSKTRHLQKEMELLSQPLLGYYQVGRLLGNISAIEVENVELTSLSVVGADIELKGEANRATEILAALAKQPWVESASFITPVNRRKGRDHFDIKILARGGENNAELP